MRRLLRGDDRIRNLRNAQRETVKRFVVRKKAIEPVLGKLPVGERTRKESERRKRTPPVTVPRGRPIRKAKTVYQTWFWAKGEMGDGFTYSGGRRSLSMKREYARKQRNPLSGEFDQSPSAFYSNEGLFLGQVKFSGKVALGDLFLMLNRSLNLYDRRGKLNDFRRVYRNWSWKYQIVRLEFPAGAKKSTGAPRKPKPVIESRQSGGSKSRRRK